MMRSAASPSRAVTGGSASPMHAASAAFTQGV